jgi:hypothetical protein
MLLLRIPKLPFRRRLRRPRRLLLPPLLPRLGLIGASAAADVASLMIARSVRHVFSPTRDLSNHLRVHSELRT